MFVSKNKYTKLEGDLEEANIEIRWLTDWKLKAEMKFSVIEKWIKQSMNGSIGKRRVMDSILDLFKQ